MELKFWGHTFAVISVSKLSTQRLLTESVKLIISSLLIVATNGELCPVALVRFVAANLLAEIGIEL